MADVKVPTINSVTFAGRAARDAELRYTQSNKAVLGFAVAINRYFKDAQGQQVVDATFVDVTVWEGAAEFLSGRVVKGRPVLVEGELRQENWEDRETGHKRSKISVVARRVHLLDWDDNGQQQQGGNGGGQQQGYGGRGDAQGGGGYQRPAQGQNAPQGANVGQRQASGYGNTGTQQSLPGAGGGGYGNRYRSEEAIPEDEIPF